MENLTKTILSAIGMIIFSVIYQITIGNQGAILVGMMVLFSIGFGWYGVKAKIEDTQGNKLKKAGIDINKFPSRKE